MMIWNRSDGQGAFFLANSLLKGHQRSLHATNSFLLLSRTLDSKKIECWVWLHCVCLVKTHRLICNMTYFGHNVTLTWGLSRSNHKSFKASVREKHDDAIVDSLSYYFIIFIKVNCERICISPVTATLTIFDLWRRNCWPEVTFDDDFMKRRVQKLSIGVICALLVITVPDTTRFLKNIITTIELWTSMTSGDPNKGQTKGRECCRANSTVTAHRIARLIMTAS